MSSSSSTVPFFLQNKVNESNDGTIMSKKIIHYNNLQRMTSVTISCKKKVMLYDEVEVAKIVIGGWMRHFEKNK